MSTQFYATFISDKTLPYIIDCQLHHFSLRISFIQHALNSNNLHSKH